MRHLRSAAARGNIFLLIFLLGFGIALALETVHTVQAGDTLYSIAKQYNTTVEQIIALNAIENPSLIYVGQQIVIQTDTVPTTANQTPTEPPAQPKPSNCGDFRFNHINIIDNNDAPDVSLEWTPYPGAAWYRVIVAQPATGAFYEYLLKGDLGMRIPTGNLSTGEYKLRILAQDSNQQTLCQSDMRSFIKDPITLAVFAMPASSIDTSAVEDAHTAHTAQPVDVSKAESQLGGVPCAGGGPAAYAILRLTNEKRAAHGLPPLTLNATLNIAACRQSNDMYVHRFMNHVGTDGSTFGQRITEAGYTGYPSAENIAQNYENAQSVFDAWWASPGHHANILGDYGPNGEMGMARVGNYWTQTFGQP